MDFQQARGIAGWFNDLTWMIAGHRVWVIALITLAGVALPLMTARRRGLPRPTPSQYFHSGGIALAITTAVVALCSMMHFGDLRWLPPDQRGSVHLNPPGGPLGNVAKPVYAAVNSVATIPAEWRATQIAIHTAIVCVALALAAFLLVILSRRRAMRAQIRVLVWEQTRPLELRLEEAERQLGLR